MHPSQSCPLLRLQTIAPTTINPSSSSAFFAVIIVLPVVYTSSTRKTLVPAGRPLREEIAPRGNILSDLTDLIACLGRLSLQKRTSATGMRQIWAAPRAIARA